MAYIRYPGANEKHLELPLAVPIFGQDINLSTKYAGSGFCRVYVEFMWSNNYLAAFVVTHFPSQR
jgi:hypothetical protein